MTNAVFLDVNMVASLEEGINVTPVHVAVKFNRCECLKILLNHGADANVPNQFGQTPLHSAVRRKLRDLVNVNTDTVYIKVGIAIKIDIFYISDAS